jgi:glycolate oxidase iron-sulfur subunit
MAASSSLLPAQSDLDKCVHCGLCLNACPTYRELGLEMDSPRGRIQLINDVANGSAVTENYADHIDKCLACRGCETACPSGVPYGRIIEGAKAHLQSKRRMGPLRRWAQNIVFRHLIHSPGALQLAGAGLYLYQRLGLQSLVRAMGVLKFWPKLQSLEASTPTAEAPFFFSQIGKVFPAQGETRYRVAFLAGCIANVAFARLNEATIRVLQANGCEVIVPAGQSCCGALHLHSGFAQEAKKLAQRNVKVLASQQVDAILTNAAGCGSTLKEYAHLLPDDDAAQEFANKTKDILEFLASIKLRPQMGPISATVTYQDSCHLAHGQKIRKAPRELLKQVPGLEYREMPAADVCCGSAGVYNVVQNEMATQILETKMRSVNTTGASWIATANPGCMLQLRAGVRLYGERQRVLHVVEVLDEAYKAYS